MVTIWAWNWAPFVSTYVFVFIMELLDNTQLIQVYYSAKYGRQWILALASWTAFICTGLIGSSFSALRALSEYVTRSIELFFALVLFTLGVVTLSHSEIILRKWEKFTSFMKHKIADPFLYKMGERNDQHEQLPDEELQAGTTQPESEKPLRSSMESLQEVELNEKSGNTSVVISDKSAAPTVSPVKPVKKEADTSNTATTTASTKKIEWWRLYILVFATVFVLELPDKTMLMIATLAQSSDFPLAIFVGYACAMVSQSLIALVVGKGIGTAAAKFGEYIELIVGIILMLTGTVKIVIMIFIGDFSFDTWNRVASSSSTFHSTSSIL